MNPHSGRSLRATPLLLACGLVGPFLFWILGGAAAASWPGYDWVAESISSLVHGPGGQLQTLAFAAGFVLSVGWAIGAGRAIGTGRPSSALVRGLFLVQAGVLLAFAVLPTDPAGTDRTLIGSLHLVTFVVYGATMPATILLVSLVFRRDPRWRWAATPSMVAGTVMLFGTILVPFTLTGPLMTWLGLLERLYVLIPTAWQAVIASIALAHSLSGSTGSMDDPDAAA